MSAQCVPFPFFHSRCSSAQRLRFFRFGQHFSLQAAALCQQLFSSWSSSFYHQTPGRISSSQDSPAATRNLETAGTSGTLWHVWGKTNLECFCVLMCLSKDENAIITPTGYCSSFTHRCRSSMSLSNVWIEQKIGGMEDVSTGDPSWQPDTQVLLAYF